MKTRTQEAIVMMFRARNHLWCLAAALGLGLGGSVCVAAGELTAAITVQAGQPGVQISTNLFGIFFEEINHAGDGGLYAELVENRSFEEPVQTNGWQFVSSGSASGSLSAVTTLPLNAANRYCGRLVFSAGSGTVAAVNEGFWGMNLEAGRTYDLNLYARCSSGFSGSITARLENATGSAVYAQASVGGLSTEWQRFSVSLTPNGSTASGRLALVITQAGTVWLDVISLFPRETFRSRTNGLRPDLANLLTNLVPAFVRFPGGCFVEGNYLSNAFRWKNTVGDIATRPGHWNAIWNYFSADGLGYHEYLQLCEDLGAEPLFVINCGMAHNEVAPLDQMNEYVQDALDAIEYANGPTSSTWGALRAAHGHPAPFDLKYIQIGNENGGSSYNDRYALFHDAITNQYPDMRIIACNWGGLPTSRPVQISDEHYYNNPAFFYQNAAKYDGYSRAGPQIYVGEFAVTSGNGGGNLAGALAEAAFMTGLERNSDIVCMSSYAPLFANLNNKAWNPDLIYFDSSRVAPTPSYHVQQMFARNRGDGVLPVSLTLTSTGTNAGHAGAIGLGAWNTQVEFTNVVVTSNGVTLYQSDFSSGAPGWTVYNGAWSTLNGLYRQTAIATDCRSTTGNTGWANYTLSLRARKTGGSEGFLILFNWLNDANFTWWNIGGWNNTQHGIEYCINGSKMILGSRINGSIETNQWYDVRLELSGDSIRCYLDDVLVHSIVYPDSTHRGAVGLGTWNTAASFTNVVVTKNGSTLYQSDFSSGAPGWTVYNGTWTTTSGRYRQTAIEVDCRSTTGETNWNDYTLSLRARKDSGSEGFLIIFNWEDDNNYTWWNIGGWNNTQHAVQVAEGGSRNILGSAVSGSVTSGRWYDIRIVLGGGRIQCYLDDNLVHDLSYLAGEPVHVSSSYAAASGQVILKAVNGTANPVPATIQLAGLATVAPDAACALLTSESPTDENTLDQPDLVAPVYGAITNAGTNFTHTLAANSLTVLRFQTPPVLPAHLSIEAGTNQNDVAAVPGGIPVRLASFITNAVSVTYTLQAANGAVLAAGTLEFAPGDLVRYMPLPPAALEPGAFFRVTLSDPVGAVIDGPTRAYFAQAPVAGAPLWLGLARYADETLLFWFDPLARLQSGTNLAGWTVVSAATTPFPLPLNQAPRFYRLIR